jgi:two-component system LytT family response regulator
MRNIDVLIVDDEIDNSNLLKHFLEQYCPSIGQIDTINSKSEAVQMINNNSYDLLFLDIILDEKTAFDLLEEVNSYPLIIFVTAFDQYAIDSFKYNAIDYILKPIEIQSLIEAVERVMVKIEKKESVSREELIHLEKSFEHQNQIDFITVSNIDKVNLIKKTDILYCKSSGRYTEFHLTNKNTLVASKSLGEYENQLYYKEFFRIHNSYMINLNHLVNISKKKGNYCQLNDGTELPISRRRFDKLLHHLNIH